MAYHEAFAYADRPAGALLDAATNTRVLAFGTPSGRLTLSGRNTPSHTLSILLRALGGS